MVADGLVWANLRGVDGHGVFHLPFYLRMVERGEMDEAAKPTLDQDRAATFVLNNNNGSLGPGDDAGDALAAERAGATGACFGLCATPPIPAPSAAICSGWRARLRAMIMGAGPAFVAYHGARVASLGTSPLAIAVRAARAPFARHGNERHLQRHDPASARYRRFATAEQRVDQEGEPTTDPTAPRFCCRSAAPRVQASASCSRCWRACLRAPIQARALGPERRKSLSQNTRSSRSMSRPFGRLWILRAMRTHSPRYQIAAASSGRRRNPAAGRRAARTEADR